MFASYVAQTRFKNVGCLEEDTSMEDKSHAIYTSKIFTKAFRLGIIVTFVEVAFQIHWLNIQDDVNIKGCHQQTSSCHVYLIYLYGPLDKVFNVGKNWWKNIEILWSLTVTIIFKCIDFTLNF